MKRILEKTETTKKKNFLVVVVRPDFMKIAPLWKELKRFVPSSFHILFTLTFRKISNKRVSFSE